MKKVLFQFTILVLLFFSSWLLLSQVNFMKHIHVDKINKINEKRIGDLIMESVKRNHKEIELSDSVNGVLTAIKDSICITNNIDPSEIQIHLFDEEVINAFTLPGQHMVVYTGLIKYCDGPDQLAGIMAHEIGHMQHSHIMKRLVKEIGIATVLSLGGGNTELLRKIVKTLSSTAFDRKQESEADASAVEDLNKSHIDPKGLADFLTKLSNERIDMPKQLEWISTHPNSKDRAKEILRLKGNSSIAYHQVVGDTEWNILKRVSNN